MSILPVAYFQGPEFYHASYAIRVEQGGEEELTQFAALARINETASKVNSHLSPLSSLSMIVRFDSFDLIALL